MNKSSDEAKPRSSRVFLSRNKSTLQKKKATTFLKRGLSIDDAVASSVLRRLPAEFVLTHEATGQVEHISNQLGTCGVEIRTQPQAVSFEPCPLHMKLGCSELCPKCDRRGCNACIKFTPARACAACQTGVKRKRVLRNLRIASLFAALIAVTYFTIVEDRRFRAWNKTIKVAIYPIEVENNPSVSAYIESLTPDAFADIGKFLSFQSIEYGVAAPAGGLFKFSLMPRLSELPPSQPPQSASMFEVAIYSLKMRFWVLKLVHLEGRDDGDLRLFVLYHNAEPGRALPHSLGLKKGRIGIVNAFAENKSTKPNAVIMAHELLHTLGASDKYDAEGEPLFPLGYADPAQRPQTPQRQGEIMSGRIPVSEGVSKIIGRLDDAVIGPETAKEIFWLKD